MKGTIATIAVLLLVLSPAFAWEKNVTVTYEPDPSGGYAVKSETDQVHYNLHQEQVDNSTRMTGTVSGPDQQEPTASAPSPRTIIQRYTTVQRVPGADRYARSQAAKAQRAAKEAGQKAEAAMGKIGRVSEDLGNRITTEVSNLSTRLNNQFAKLANSVTDMGEMVKGARTKANWAIFLALAALAVALYGLRRREPRPAPAPVQPQPAIPAPTTPQPTVTPAQPTPAPGGQPSAPILTPTQLQQQATARLT